MKLLILLALIPVAVGQQTKKPAITWKAPDSSYALQLPSSPPPFTPSKYRPLEIKCNEVKGSISKCDWYEPPLTMCNAGGASSSSEFNAAEPQKQSIKPTPAFDENDPNFHRPNYVPYNPEPIDVPAIQVTHEEEYGNYDWCNHCDPPDAGGLTSCTAMSCNPHAKHKLTVDTCKDKSRVLLTAEDGSKHCIKFR